MHNQHSAASVARLFKLQKFINNLYHSNRFMKNIISRTIHYNIKMIKTYMNSITVEPILFLHNAASQMVWVTSQDLMLEKACKINYGYDDWICDDIHQHEEEEEKVQDLVSSFLMWKSILEASIKLVVILFLGSWSDNWGRKWPITISLICLGLEAGLYLVTYVATSWPLEYLLISAIPYSISGGSHALLMLTFSFLTEKFSQRHRTIRMGILDIMWYLGSPVGLALVSPLFDAGSYYAVFGTGMGIYAIAVAYTVVRLKNPSKPSSSSDGGACSTCSLDQITEAVEAVGRSRENRVTFHIILLIVAMMLDALAVSGASNVKYLFTQRALDWNRDEYSRWASVASFLTVVGGAVVLPLATLKFNLVDPIIGIVGGASRTLSSIIYATVRDPSDEWVMYLGAFIASTAALAPISIRALLSKLAGPKDVGKVFAVMGAAETLVPFAAAPIYRSIYVATDDVYPAAYNWFSAFINSGIVIAFGIVMCTAHMGSPASLKYRPQRKEDETVVEARADEQLPHS